MGREKTESEGLSLEVLLDLNGEVFLMENGNWTKFEAFRIDPTPEIPNGIRYSLTFHDRNNRRVLGFDIAHVFKPRKKRYGARKITWDHLHKKDKIYPYEYESVSQLLEDFWAAVKEITG
jgi:hypothetical protein